MLNKFFILEHVRKALEEDIGFGDITTDYLTNEEEIMKCELNSRDDGILSGRAVFETVFELLSPKVRVTFYKKDGDIINPFGMTGTMKLKKYLNAKGVSRHNRDGLFVLANENEIFWVVGVGLSNKIGVTKKPTHVIELI